MTPAEAKRIDREEFARESASSLERALAYAKKKQEIERHRFLRFVYGDNIPASALKPKAAKRNGGSVAKLYHVDGVEKTIDQWAEHLRISRQALQSRRKELGSLEAAIRGNVGVPRPRAKTGVSPKLYAHDGKSMSIRAWAESVGMSADSLRHRLTRGMSMGDALASAYNPRKGERVAAKAKAANDNALGVVSNFWALQGTGAGSTLQETPEITFSETTPRKAIL